MMTRPCTPKVYSKNITNILLSRVGVHVELAIAVQLAIAVELAIVEFIAIVS